MKFEEARLKAATKTEVYTTGQGTVVLRVQNGRHTVEAYLGPDAARVLSQALFQSSQKEMLILLQQHAGGIVGKL